LSGVTDTAYAKINLALHVREKRADGYHRIETVFAFCEDGDEISAEAADALSLKVTGEFGRSLEANDNLVLRAAQALQDALAMDKGAAFHLRKQLPIASGVGGGSADAAAALRLLNRLWQGNLPIERLEEVGRSLGADVAACVRSEAMVGQGRGDELQPVDLHLSAKPVLLVNPRVELSTAEVFARWDGIDRGPLEDWHSGRNDLQAAASALVPQIDGVLAWLMAQPGTSCVRMSGSGATCFALFESEAARDHSAIAVPREWWSLPTRLR
jgi:4-diphosphocytidyl-2-C-methyl-D-erythritol kinase